MEDILASIKRIIAEDSEAVAPRAPRPVRRETAPVADTVVEERVEAPYVDVPAAADSDPAPIAVAPPMVSEAPPVSTADILELTSPIAEDAAP
ncbi:MAG TPA: DUF2497 domain-containing protein, partial [Sphingomonas sp.]